VEILREDKVQRELLVRPVAELLHDLAGRGAVLRDIRIVARQGREHLRRHPHNLRAAAIGSRDVALAVLDDLMKALRSRLSATARRSSGLSNGGFSGLRIRLRLTLVEVSTHTAVGAWLLTSSSNGTVVP